MDQFARYGMVCLVALMAVSIATANLAEASDSDERELVRVAMEDLTPQQEYRNAVHDAERNYWGARQDCAGLADMDLRTCLREAREAYERDILEARIILKTR